MSEEDALGRGRRMEEKEDEEAKENDQNDAIFGLEEGTGAKRKHAVDKMFERFSKKGNVEFGFGESGPMCMGTDSGLAAIVQLAISECKFLGGDDDGDVDEGVDGLRMGPRDPTGCRDTERSAREMMRRSCMVEVLAWTDEKGRSGGSDFFVSEVQSASRYAETWHTVQTFCGISQITREFAQRAPQTVRVLWAFGD